MHKLKIIQIYTPTLESSDKEIEWFHENIGDAIDRKKQIASFQRGGLQCKESTRIEENREEAKS